MFWVDVQTGPRLPDVTLPICPVFSKILQFFLPFFRDFSLNVSGQEIKKIVNFVGFYYLFYLIIILIFFHSLFIVQFVNLFVH